VAKQYVNPGGLVKVPAEPVREGYTFDGWFLDGAPYDFAAKVTKGITLTARWTAIELPAAIPAGLLDTAFTGPYIFGDEKGQMRPDAAITRAEAAAIFYRILAPGTVIPAVSIQYPDVAAEAWYAPAVNSLSALGVFTGYPDGNFRPDATITRGEFTAVVARAERLTAGTALPFADVTAAYWACGYIAAAYERGYINGLPDGLFHPTENIDRASVVKIVNDILGRAANPAPESPFPDLDRNHWAYGAIVAAAGA
jgi:uncharacterized repeat protein (TIGR02543 family)